MKKITLLIGITIGFLAGCAPEAAKVQSQYVSPEIYANYDCRQIGAEFGRLSRRAEEIGAVVDKQASDDAAQTFVGLVIFWPALFFLEGGETQQSMEYGRLKGEMEALEKVSVEKGCGADIQHLAETVESDPSLVPTGTNPQKLETLKVLYRDGAITEEEYLKRRKELTEDQAKEELALMERQKAAAAKAAAAKSNAQTESTETSRLNVAIFPVSTVSGSTITEDVLYTFGEDAVKSEPSFTLVYSYDDAQAGSGRRVDPKAIWPAGFSPRKKPNVDRVFAYLSELEADIGVLYFYGARTADGYAHDRFWVDVYVFDSANKKFDHKKADEKNYKEKTRDLLKVAALKRGIKTKSY